MKPLGQRITSAAFLSLFAAQMVFLKKLIDT
jgi:hypothetical protein